ncbi:glycosyl hydrolase family 95 catalytic domain-containing protein [Dinghuibacter silviterrae]|uniref:Uncharacterized protein DUF4982 n=1 Tax=Dinghuibacter silviterrae TaxID=1539049 RepID=A0A4R8DV78_9BACT|nr:glycoside hydrolase N-terminal domain-containing protein [Dinghuibacter silviterrae]TDX01375.1 uncharacterized protein DUF4982 [Dinghuibacter silviterrae]
MRRLGYLLAALVALALTREPRSDGRAGAQVAGPVDRIGAMKAAGQNGARAAAPPPDGDTLLLWYTHPARGWTEALPIGNGRLGAMIYGGVDTEHLQFNEATLWTGGPRSYQRPDAHLYLKPIRKLLAEGRQDSAMALAEQHFMGAKDKSDSVYALQKTAWLRKVRSDTSGATAADEDWPTMPIPTLNGWETEGLEGVDGALWFHRSFVAPDDWKGKDLVLDLGKIRDEDFTYVNGVRVGAGEGINNKRRYIIKAGIVRPGVNRISVQVINYFDKGGLVGVKGSQPTLEISAGSGTPVSLRGSWKYHIQDENPPSYPQYEASYQPFGDVLLEDHATGEAKDYRRSLNLDDATGLVSYTRAGVHYTRTYFAGEDGIVMRLRADRRGALRFTALLQTPHREHRIFRVDEHTLGLSLKVRDGVMRGVSYLRVQAKGGHVTATSDGLNVDGADEVTLYLVAATNFKNYKDVSADPIKRCNTALQHVDEDTYAAHVRAYRYLFDGFHLNLGHGPNENLPTNERIKNFTEKDDPSLVALYLQYARYLLISSSMPGTGAANLQGIWNNLLTPPWGSKYTTNINLEMNYWPVDELHLSGCAEPLFRLIGEVAEAGKATAKDYYDAPGWVLHHNTDQWRGTAPINASTHGIWVSGGAWLCHHIWDHFRYTQDTGWLQKEYPVMRSAADFACHFLVPDPQTGWLISTPSNSPEHGGLVAGPTMDHQIIRDLLTNCIAASRVLRVDSALRGRWASTRDRIAPNRIGRYGQLQEWLEDKDDTADEHRHVSHLWGVYPGTDITWADSALLRAARTSLRYRGDGGTGWSLAWKVNLLARFREGDHALRLLDKLLSPADDGAGEKGGVYPNLFDAHPPFQIDGNFGGAAGIAEMLVQSQGTGIDLLPALPAAWANGSVDGLGARGGFTLALQWSAGALTRAVVHAAANGPCTLVYHGQVVRFDARRGVSYLFDGTLTSVGTVIDGWHAELHPEAGPRVDFRMDEDWRTVMDPKNQHAFDGFERPGFPESAWKRVSVPHNWDDYGGYRRLVHGNLHGYAWYRKIFFAPMLRKDQRCFLYFEGVGSYATVWVNGVLVGTHAGGRTTFTLDVTRALHHGVNLLAVRADHPAFITDLPWVCGGCSDDRGFSEGSQPMGIFRPVHLLVTGAVHVAPFGVHLWNEDTSGRVHAEVDVTNDDDQPRRLTVTVNGTEIAGAQLQAGETKTLRGDIIIREPHLWSPEDPFQYKAVAQIRADGIITDQVTTPFGIRTITWEKHRLLVNGRPVFINGIAEYEHRLGGSHAFEEAEIRARAGMIRAAGFNAFRDAHQPHNLLYGQIWDSTGLLWWPQFSAHIWFDTPAFRQNFLRLLTDWIRERRNEPSVILWGLQNESHLPADFARLCVDTIRKLDPTASIQRLVTTCNGGEGTDWDVPQNWTGTYGGDPATYASDLKRQVLVGEYGAWRTTDLHTEGPFIAKGPYSEERMDQLLEMKLNAADSVRADAVGQFFWLFSSHDNPGRVQSGEGLRELDRIGPVNYKGLLTEWGEPVDAYYLFRAHLTRGLAAAAAHGPGSGGAAGPMVYIVSHTWPDRWKEPGIKNNITIFSNCDEVELFNDVNAISLGRKRPPFRWDSVDVQYNVLYAKGYIGGKVVASDSIVLRHLPAAPHFDDLYAGSTALTAPAPGYYYWYRVHCGGPAYTDRQGNTWMADRERHTDTSWGSSSWTDDYPGLPASFASQRQIFDPVRGTTDWPLFQTFRYGRDKLRYTFPLPDGDYRVELYFMEPWYGEGGGVDATGWRLFDVAFNGETVLQDVDLWKEAGTHGAVKKVVTAHVSGGRLDLSFPRVAAGQAVISAIAIAGHETGIPAGSDGPVIHWLDNDTIGTPAYDVRSSKSYAPDSANTWHFTLGVADTYSLTVRYINTKGPAAGMLTLMDAGGVVLKKEQLTFKPTATGKKGSVLTDTGGMINAGAYTVRVTGDVQCVALDVQ